MRPTLPTILLLAMLFGLVACNQADPDGGSNIHKSPTSEVQLVSAVRTITPGQPILLGLRFQPADGWHIYWRNPGDSGAAPVIEWQAPEGFTFGPILWPAPTRYATADFADYGYGSDTMLMVEAQAPQSLVPGETVTLVAQAEWLICEDSCIPEFADFSLTLPVSDAAPEDTRWREVFESNQRRLPVAREEMTATATATDGNTIILDIQAPESLGLAGKDIHFFAYAQGVIEPGAPQEVSVSGSAVRATLQKSAFLAQLPNPLQGVLVARPPGSARDTDALLFEISAPLVEEAPEGVEEGLD